MRRACRLVVHLCREAIGRRASIAIAQLESRQGWRGGRPCAVRRKSNWTAGFQPVRFPPDASAQGWSSQAKADRAVHSILAFAARLPDSGQMVNAPFTVPGLGWSKGVKREAPG